MFMPSLTRPKMVCLRSRKGVGARVTNCQGAVRCSEKVIANRLLAAIALTNWLPFVFGPLFAMASTPAPTKRNSGVISSLNCVEGSISSQRSRRHRGATPTLSP